MPKRYEWRAYIETDEDTGVPPEVEDGLLEALYESIEGPWRHGVERVERADDPLPYA